MSTVKLFGRREKLKMENPMAIGIGIVWTERKRSGTFKAGVPVGEWTTYDAKGKPYKVTQIKVSKS